MNNLKSKSSLVVGIVMLGMSGTVVAQTLPANYGYWVDSRGIIVKNSYGECWRAGYWTPALAVVECDPSLVPKAAPMPEPEAAPAPAPAPVIAPPPPPPPAPPPETWKTSILEKQIRLEGANFATGSSRLLPGASAKLDEVVNQSKDHPEIGFEVSGYTDSTGNAQSNVRLSQARADAVKNYLVGKGVADSRISTRGFGEENPIADNKTAEGRATNRRVEIRYTDKEEIRVRVPQ